MTWHFHDCLGHKNSALQVFLLTYLFSYFSAINAVSVKSKSAIYIIYQ